MRNLIKLILIMVFVFFQIHHTFAMEIAITVDDLPENGNLPTNLNRIDLVKKMLLVFKKHHVSGVYGLINGNKVSENSEGLNVLSEWVKAGHYLGNHTFEHLDLAKVSTHDYIVDIQKNEPILARLMPKNNYHYFRYPYLSEGNTQVKRDGIRQFLFQNNYQIASVTVDFFEYEWNDPYVRCLNKRDEKSIQWLRETYIEQANNALVISHELSQLVFKRDIKNVLLIHINAFTVEILDELLTAYEKQNVKFISLADALSDEVYQINPNVVRDRAYTFLNQVRLGKGLNNPEIVEKLYATLPEDKLNQLCR